jgi:hypothetical protein
MTLLLAKRSPDARPSAKARAAKHRDDLEGLSETIPKSPPDERSPSDGPAELGEGPLLESKAPDLRFALWDFYAQSCFESQVSLQHIAALLQRRRVLHDLHGLRSENSVLSDEERLPGFLHLDGVLLKLDTGGVVIMLEKESPKNQVSPGLPYPNTTELAGFMKVNATPAAVAE